MAVKNLEIQVPERSNLTPIIGNTIPLAVRIHAALGTIGFEPRSCHTMRTPPQLSHKQERQ